MMGHVQLLASLGTDPKEKREIELDEKWLCYSLNHDGKSSDIPIILVERGPKNIAEIKKRLKNYDTCIVLFAERNTLFLKSPNESLTKVLENDSEYKRIASILSSCGISGAADELDMTIGIKKAIDKIPNATSDFDNRGLFSTHYLRSRIFEDVRRDMDEKIIHQKIGESPDVILQALGWNITNSDRTYYDGKVSITITDQTDFSIRKNDKDVAPSYTAVASLRESQWAILTNGKKWRLYTSKISASSTNYFEMILDQQRVFTTRYLVALFGALSYEEKEGKTDIDTFFEEGKNYAIDLEEDLSSKIMSADGLFLDIVKGVLDHDMKKTFTSEELENAKQTSLKIMYRIWFLAYAESRNLLPVRDEKYKPISLQSLRSHLDLYQSEPDGEQCWNDLLTLFKGIRKGSAKHNLPQYAGDLFKHLPQLDDLSIRNEFIVNALYGLLERDGEAIDYTNLNVRHLGNIFETLMEFGVRQAEKDIMLLVDKDGVREVKTHQQSTYSYKKNDLYLASKGGIALRKMSASFYTPDKIVEFLIWRGIKPIFEEREKQIEDDLNRYKKSKSEKDLQTCMDRLLDIQVLDPAMGSGHFLVEALNRITSWATDVLKRHPEHPLLSEIESDRNIILAEQKKKGITIDENLLTHDVLLKRKIMKRCIFGVDLNPMAVELAKLSLWLDSFAIGVPLTYMDHHIKHGDSTIGMFLDDMKNKEMHTLDDWTPSSESNKMICDVICSSDITIEQVHASEDKYLEHKKLLEPTRRILDALAASKINPKILPKKAKDEFIHRFGLHSKNESKDFTEARRLVNELAEKHHFFHYELEMMDAFTDSRSGFDLITGNPPWEKVKPSNDEFFTPYDMMFRTLKPNTKKRKRIKELLKNSEIKEFYEAYKKDFEEKGMFYRMYEMQGVGDRDLWKLLIERVIHLVAKDCVISMVIPSQLLTSTGATDLRKYLLDRNILSLYVFENRKKIFDIDSRYRFALLSFRNKDGPDEFPVGFYLYYLQSLFGDNKEMEKFYTLSKKIIHKLHPNELLIPETGKFEIKILEKISHNNTLESGLEEWSVGITSGFHKTKDVDLLSEDGKGWPVFEGKHVHQYNHKWATSEFTSNKRDGLERENRKKIFGGKHKEIYDSYRLVFRKTSSPTNMRTIIATIIPPHIFYIDTLHYVVLTSDEKIILDSHYYKIMLYLCGIFNSSIFDFTARSNAQMYIPAVIKSLPLPNHDHKYIITELVAKLIVGTPEFEGLAESLHIPNTKLSPAQRIETTAELDALVAHSYGLTKDEYKTVIDSFKLFKKNPSLYDLEEITWDNNNLKEFYGEMAELALQYFETITGEDKK